LTDQESRKVIDQQRARQGYMVDDRETENMEASGWLRAPPSRVHVFGTTRKQGRLRDRETFHVDVDCSSLSGVHLSGPSDSIEKRGEKNHGLPRVGNEKHPFW
jgi:hypothetical protein